jgi:hypothetical protein
MNRTAYLGLSKTRKAAQAFNQGVVVGARNEDLKGLEDSMYRGRKVHE